MTDRLQNAFHAFGRSYETWVDDLLTGELKPAQLRLLCQLQHDGPQIMSDLGERLGVTPRYVTALVDALEAGGLVERSAHPGDRRAIVITPTARGHEVGHTVVETYRRASAELIAVLTEKQQRDLLACLETLQAELARRGYGQAPATR